MSDGSTLRGVQALVNDAQAQVGAAKENLSEAVAHLIKGLEVLKKEMDRIDPDTATEMSKDFKQASDYIGYAVSNLNDLDDR